jgi:hypothetical protein
LCKESAAPVIVGIALAWLLGAAPKDARFYTRVLSIIFIPVSLAIFYFNTNILPAYLEIPYAYAGVYGEFGTSFKDILLAPIQKPILFLEHIFQKDRLKFLWQTLAPLGLLPLLAPRVIVAAVPGLMMLFLGAGSQRVTTGFHYVIEPAIGFFWALPAGIAFLYAVKKGRRYPALQSLRPYLSGRQVAVYLLCAAVILYGRSEMHRVRWYSPSAHSKWVKTEVLPCLSEASLAASDALVPHLSDRHWIHYLPTLEMPGNTMVSCVIQDQALSNWPMGVEEQKNLEQVLQKNFDISYQCGTVKIYEQKNTGSRCLKCAPACKDSERL